MRAVSNMTEMRLECQKCLQKHPMRIPRKRCKTRIFKRQDGLKRLGVHFQPAPSSPSGSTAHRSPQLDVLHVVDGPVIHSVWLGHSDLEQRCSGACPETWWRRGYLLAMRLIQPQAQQRAWALAAAGTIISLPLAVHKKTRQEGSLGCIGARSSFAGFGRAPLYPPPPPV